MVMEAFERAVNSGEVAATGLLTLAQDPKRNTGFRADHAGLPGLAPRSARPANARRPRWATLP
ncbi:hypothetical protein LP420_03770 [Massilia sp. B-10]|nr:hypothetical protein LP420_03770 [Massilia sp. B-10]